MARTKGALGKKTIERMKREGKKANDNKKIKKKNNKINKKTVNVTTRDPKLYILDLCKKCKNNCKISAVKNSKLIYCPDFLDLNN